MSVEVERGTGLGAAGPAAHDGLDGRIVDWRGGADKLELAAALTRAASARQVDEILPAVEDVSTRLRASGAVAKGSGSERVLLVEDNATVRGLVELMLRDQGYEVVAASLPSEALALFGDQPSFDIVVTDVVMPEMNGRELVERLQAQQAGVGVLYTSGYTDDAMVARGALVPGVAFLQKPFTLSQLTQKVREVLDASCAGRGTP